MRSFADPETGQRSTVRLAPMERRGTLGVDRRLNALVFETEAGEWVGSAPVYHNVTLESMGGAELQCNGKEPGATDVAFSWSRFRHPWWRGTAWIAPTGWRG